jgi:hypothetical protein
MTDLQHPGAADGVGELPYPGAALSLSLPCWAGDLPTRVVAPDGSLLSVRAPIHVCGNAELAQAFTAARPRSA